MCYSAQVVQMVRKLNRQLGIRLDYEEAQRLFFRRLEDPTLILSRGFEANFDEPTDDRGSRIKRAIDEHRARTATKLERELFTQRTRLVTAGRSLQEKENKKAREDVRIATRKIETITEKLRDLRRVEVTGPDNRIFPRVHAGVIVRRDGENLLTPMRYACRPAGKPASYDKKFPGLYNARRDNLEKFWNEQFGLHHAVMVVESLRKRSAACDGAPATSRRRESSERGTAVHARTRPAHVHRLFVVALDRRPRTRPAQLCCDHR